MRRWMLASILLPLALTALPLLAGCSSGSTPDDEAPNPLFADVVFEGGADQKALAALLDTPTKDDPNKGAEIDAPPPSSLLDAAMVTTFSWHSRDGSAAEPGAPPMNGTGYFLLFSTDSTPRLLRVFTTRSSYTPDAKAWATLSSAAIWTTLDVFAASFADDAIAPGGGPFKGGSVQFCIEKK